MGDNTKLRSKELVRLARTELAREQADVLAFANKNRGGCDALCYDLADFIDAVAVGTCATQAFACLAVLETSRQLDDLAIPVDEGKQVSLLLACKLITRSTRYARKLFRSMQSLSVRAPRRRLRVWPFSRPAGSSTISRFLSTKASATSLHQIADALNARGISTPRGARWYANSVSSLLARSM